MDLATFQWLGGIAILIILGLVGWIARDHNDKMKELKDELHETRDESARLRNLMDGKVELLLSDTNKKAEALHLRINSEARDLADVRETLAGFQGTFLTREEHGRYCQQQQQRTERM